MERFPNPEIYDVTARAIRLPQGNLSTLIRKYDDVFIIPVR